MPNKKDDALFWLIHQSTPTKLTHPPFYPNLDHDPHKTKSAGRLPGSNSPKQHPMVPNPGEKSVAGYFCVIRRELGNVLGTWH